MSKKNKAPRNRLKKSGCRGNCALCDDCLYIGEGDYWCSEGRGIVGEDFEIYGPQGNPNPVMEVKEA